MKLNLAEIQALDILLNIVAYKTESNKLKIVVNSNNELISFDVFKEYSCLHPYYDYLDEYYNQKTTHLSNQNEIMNYCINFYEEHEYDNSLSKIKDNKNILLTYFLTLIKKKSFKNPIQNSIFNVEFLHSKLKLDFYQLDPSKEYEVVSLI